MTEALGSAVVAVAVVSLGHLATTHDGASVRVAIQAVGTALTLAVVILLVGPHSGSHLNPAVTLAKWLSRVVTGREAAAYAVAQVAGGLVGVVITTLLLGGSIEPTIHGVPGGSTSWPSEVLVTMGLVAMVLLVARRAGVRRVAVAVGGYVMLAAWVAPALAIANPAITLARTIADAPTAVAATAAPALIAAQLVGAVLGAAAVRALDGVPIRGRAIERPR